MVPYPKCWHWSLPELGERSCWAVTAGMQPAVLGRAAALVLAQAFGRKKRPHGCVCGEEEGAAVLLLLLQTQSCSAQERMRALHVVLLHSVIRLRSVMRSDVV